jgi:hypothetical protein
LRNQEPEGILSSEILDPIPVALRGGELRSERRHCVAGELRSERSQRVAGWFRL